MPYYPPMGEHETVIKAALRVIEATHYGNESNPHASAEHEYAQEQLALAGRALAQAVDALPADDQPIGWATIPDSTATEAPDPQAPVVVDQQTLVSLVEDLLDADPCWFDHHGYCQAHGWTAADPACPHGRAKALFPELEES